MSLYDFSPKDEDGSLDVMGYPESLLLPDPLPEPVAQAKILIDQIASHSVLLGLTNS